ncbi:hypothetical protein JOB18_025748 [Solea senegalensis]|uniref:Uncharacterized protein n=1 Tax=Solea senegalensis TaxID=28829 RepID=A0AAV6T7E2_SOLSE|nr:hypothetical protein JOB18_025748 [Solea senegalensis]
MCSISVVSDELKKKSTQSEDISFGSRDHSSVRFYTGSSYKIQSAADAVTDCVCVSAAAAAATAWVTHFPLRLCFFMQLQKQRLLAASRAARWYSTAGCVPLLNAAAA